MNKGMFILSTEELAWLAPTEAVQAFRQLLWAGATARLIAKTVIDVLGSVTVRAHVALQDLTPDPRAGPHPEWPLRADRRRNLMDRLLRQQQLRHHRS